MKAFTLIELLVTVAIVGVLMGILAPSLAGGRAAARVTVCHSNLRQLQVGAIADATTGAWASEHAALRCPADRSDAADSYGGINWGTAARDTLRWLEANPDTLVYKELGYNHPDRFGILFSGRIIMADTVDTTGN